MTLLQSFNDDVSADVMDLPQLMPGMTVKVHQRIVEEVAAKGKGKDKEKEKKERIQIFEGLIIAKRGSKPAQCTITVRKLSQGIGVERIFPLSSPTVKKIEIVRKSKVRRAKLYFMRDLRGKGLRLKELALSSKELAEMRKVEEEEKMIHLSKMGHSRETVEAVEATPVVSAEPAPTESAPAVQSDQPTS